MVHPAARADAVGDAEPERDAGPRRDLEGDLGRAAKEVVGGAGRDGRQRLTGPVEEQDARITKCVAARAADVAQRKAELSVAGGPLLAEERNRQPGRIAARRAETGAELV